jgi:hypothetical protein
MSRESRTLALPILLVALATTPAALAQAATQPGAAKQSPTPAGHLARSRYMPDRFAGKAGRYYRAVWGVDDLSVKLVESGELLRFNWRVLSPERAAVLSDKRLEPALIDPEAGVSLVVPAMEKIGKLRQGTPPVEGKSYWMTFSNKGRKVKRGDRVNVVIGAFHADGLVVD